MKPCLVLVGQEWERLETKSSDRRVAKGVRRVIVEFVTPEKLFPYCRVKNVSVGRARGHRSWMRCSRLEGLWRQVSGERVRWAESALTGGGR